MRSELSPLGPIEAALAASNVGTWEWDVEEDVARCCAITARLFGFSPDEAAQGLAERRFTSRVVLQDREAYLERLQQAMDKGGLFVTEYRTEPQPGRINWLLVRGRFETDGDGIVRKARGIVIDVTESRENGQLDGHEFFVTDVDPAKSPLERAADHALALWNIQSRVEFGEQLAIESELRSLLMKIARGLVTEAEKSAACPAPTSIPH